MTLRNLFFSFMLLTCSFAKSAENNVYVSGFFGVSNLVLGSAPPSDADISFGARGSYLLSDYFSAGLYLSHYSNSQNVWFHEKDRKDSSTNFMAEFTYHFSNGHTQGLWLSALIGLNRLMVGSYLRDIADLNPENSEYVENTRNNFAFGFSSGYQFNLTESLSLGPQFTLIYVTGRFNKFYDISASANLKYNFDLF